MKKIFIIFLIITGSLYAQERTAIFGGGCFWCIEAAFQPLKGVLSAVSGYMGGEASTANYTDVSKGNSGHYEVVQVRYDTKIISYKELLDIFWKNIDPTDPAGQFADKGKQYESIIYYQNNSEKVYALASKKALDDSGRFSSSIVTKIEAVKVFYPAEAYHQDYFKKNSLHYQLYKIGSGRAGYIEKTWK
jgi:methionine-S-sulfoxide reductase